MPAASGTVIACGRLSGSATDSARVSGPNNGTMTAVCCCSGLATARIRMHSAAAVSVWALDHGGHLLRQIRRDHDGFDLRTAGTPRHHEMAAARRRERCHARPEKLPADARIRKLDHDRGARQQHRVADDIRTDDELDAAIGDPRGDRRQGVVAPETAEFGVLAGIDWPESKRRALRNVVEAVKQNDRVPPLRAALVL